VKQRVAFALSLLSFAVLAGCGGSSSTPPTNSQPLSKNWQLTMAPQVDGQNNPIFTGGLTGGFLQQKGNSVTGSLAYLIVPTGATGPCAAGAAVAAGTVNGQTVTLTVVAGAQTFTLTGTFSGDQSTLSGTYSATDGAALAAGGTCGTAQTGLAWSATSVPTLTGSFQGNIHQQEVYTITGTLLQGPNTGASSATVTGEIFSLDDPCFAHASLNGTISGSSVLLSVIADDGSVIGEIGLPGDNNTLPVPGAVTQAASGVLVLRAVRNGQGFAITTTKCKAGGGDFCLGTSASGCSLPISFSVSSIAFPPQLVGTSRAETLTLTNTDPMGATQSGNLQFQTPISDFPPPSLAASYNFSESDTCGPAAAVGGSVSFTLSANQSCTITVTFAPRQSCSKDPTPAAASNLPPLLCPSPGIPAAVSASDLSAPPNPDGTTPTFAVDISGAALSAIAPIEAEVGFGALAVGQTSPAQTVTLINSGLSPVMILPPLSSQAICAPSPITPPRTTDVVPGLQVITPSSISGVAPFPDGYACDGADPNVPNGPPIGPGSFPITADTCSGVTLNPRATCSFKIAFSQQALLGNPNAIDGFHDFYVQLSTLQCAEPPAPNSPCEIDSGRFPIALKWNNQSSLRISPNAGFDFGPQIIGSDTVQTFTIFNDPADPMAGDVNFVSISTRSATSRFSQTNTCVGSKLASGSSCTITVIFHPTGTSLAQDAIAIVPTPGVQQNIYVWGRGQ